LAAPLRPTSRSELDKAIVHGKAGARRTEYKEIKGKQ
jgi:hypothetical protein